MRKIKDILRLRYEAGLALRGIANALNIGYGTVVDYLNRAQQAEIGWPIPEGMNERDLGRLLFPTQAITGQRRFTEPDFLAVCQELKRKGVTKQLLWQEYRQQHPDDGYSYAQFCHRYRVWLSSPDGRGLELCLAKSYLSPEQRRLTILVTEEKLLHSMQPCKPCCRYSPSLDPPAKHLEPGRVKAIVTDSLLTC